MKKFIAAFLCVSLAMCACGFNIHASAENAEQLHIVTTIFPLYDWIREIVGDAPNVQVIMLVDSGVDLHNFQVSVDDMIQIANADVFIYVGGESDGWVDAALNQAGKDSRISISLFDVLGDRLKAEELVEGMQEADEDEEEEAYDEHVWLSLRNVAVFCQAIADCLSEVDAANRDAYQVNAATYIERLNALDAAYQEAISAAKRDTILVADRFPFRYMAEDYGFQYYAAFSGCASETEASFETIIFLTEKVNELGLNVILQLESSDGSIPSTIRQNSKAKDQEILTMNSLQALTSADAEAGASYLAIMEENLNVLKLALE